MLTVTRLKLSNICQYEEIDIPIQTGLMAVCGRNGSGKSTLLRGLMYGLTGLVDGSWGTQQNLQRDGCVIPGYVMVSLKDDQQNRELIIKRYSVSGPKFPDNVVEFKEGVYKEVATRRKTVDAYLSELYGIPVTLLFQLVWGRQGQLDLLLTAPAAYVSTFLSGVWDCKFLETLREKLKLSIDQIAVMADPGNEILSTAKELKELEDNTKEQYVQLESLTVKLQQLRQQKQQLDQKVSSSSLEDAKKAAALSGRISQVTQQLAMTLHMLSGRDLDAVKDKPLEELQESLKVTKEDLKTTLEAITARTADRDKYANDIKITELKIRGQQEELTRLSSVYDRIQSVLKQDTVHCRFCNGVILDKPAYDNALCDVMGYGHPEDLEQQIKVTGIRIDELNKQLEDSTVEKEQRELCLRVLIEGKERLEQDVQRLTDEVTTANFLVQYNNLDMQKEQLQQELDKCDKNAIDEELNATITAVTAQITEAEQAYHNLQQEQLKTHGRIEALKQIQERLEQEQEQHDVNASARSLLVLLRDVFSQQRAQARYFATKAVELNQHLQHFLELTGMPFNLRLDPDKRLFSYTTEDGFEHPTAHLSGAQKNISAVALQMALVEVIKPNINLFLFDEPSESLDIENKYVMAELFRRMNRLLPSIGGTMLIVSRDEQLIESCENVINIQQATKEETTNGTP